MLSNNYKFKDLKLYASTEWLADGCKKYQKVFENVETSYLYVELSFYNKHFDEYTWDSHIDLKCFKLNESGKEELCHLSLDKEVLQTEPIVYIREGWGHDEPGHFWKRGDYIWEAYINSDLVGSTYFYVEDGGPVTDDMNPYFDIDYVRLYEGGNAGVENEDRIYLKQFMSEETRYVWVEFTVENLQDRAWFCELTFNFYNGSRFLKGKTTELRQIKPAETDVTFITGWGSDVQGTWYEDKYTLEIVFMDQLIAVVPFECGERFLEGNAQVLQGEDALLSIPDEVDLPEDDEELELSLQQLEGLVGLQEIKKRIKDYVQYLDFLKLRKMQGFDENEQINLHSIFTGNPGTGKTTVARLLGKIYHQMGLLTNGKFHEVGRAELIGQYIGQTAPKVKDMIENARGGVLFIDEAYALVRNEDDDKDYGHEVVEILVKEMSDGPGDLAIFAAGYPKEMATFINSNPGMKSRFKMHFEFPDYTPQELMEIAASMARIREVSFTKGSKNLLKKHMTGKFRERDGSFGNARLVSSIIDDAKMAMGLRVMKELDNEQPNNRKLKVIKREDLQNAFTAQERVLPEIEVDKESLMESMDRLNQLIGLQGVKSSIHELLQLVHFYRESKRDVLGNFSLHTIFKGNPGTGKTTIARILANIYKALGIIERGHLVECSRKDLVAGFIGQTALKTKAILEQAKGGILFIDEAYSLFSEQGTHDFGKEALEVILKEMEDERGNFIVIMAGYTEEMNKLLNMNPGLKSRFDKELLFEDFSVDELLEVALFMFKELQLKLTKDAQTHLRSYLLYLSNFRDKYFGNAREVRKMVDQIIKNQHLRLASTASDRRTKKVLSTVVVADMQDFVAGKEPIGQNGKLGFNFNAS